MTFWQIWLRQPMLHHAHLVLPKGDSHRLAETLAGRAGGDPAGDLTPARRENTRPAAWKTGGRQPGESKTTQPDFLMAAGTFAR